MSNERSVSVSNNKGGIMIKKTIVILACGAVIAPVPFAQPRSTQNKQTNTATEQAITVTGTIIKMTTGEGSAASYQPFKTLVVREDRSNTPGSYVLNGRGHVVNKNGEVIQKIGRASCRER